MVELCASTIKGRAILENTPVRHPQGRYQASSRDLGVSQPPQGVDQLTHPLDTAGEAVSGDPALRRAQTRQIALNFRNFRNLEVTSDAVRPVMAVYWGGEAMTLNVCHDCTCVAAGSPIMHSFCGLLGPGTSPKCARNEIWTVYAAFSAVETPSGASGCCAQYG